MNLPSEQIETYEREGYLVVPGVLSDEEIEGFLAGQHQDQAAGVEFHLRSHEENTRWKQIATHPHTAGIAAQLIGSPVRLVQSMYLPKSPFQGEKPSPGIALHQDTHYLPAEDRSLTACWIAMTDTDGDNGGLCVVPGSHKGELRATHVNKDDDHVSWEHEQLFRDRSGKEWTEKVYAFQIEDVDDENLLRLSVPRGSAVFFQGMTIHGSFANRSPDRARLAFAIHYIAADSLLLRTDVQDGMLVES